MAIVYKDVMKQLKEAGFSSPTLRQKRLLSESTMTRLRTNQPISTEQIDIICTLLHCQPNDIMEVVDKNTAVFTDEDEEEL